MNTKKTKTNVSVAETKEQQTMNGVVGSVTNSGIKVELFDKDNSVLANNDLANRIGQSFEKSLNSLCEGGFNLESNDEIRYFVNALNDNSVPNHFKAYEFECCLGKLSHTCSSLGIEIEITLENARNSIKQIFISSYEYKIITAACFGQANGTVISNNTPTFAYGEEAHLYKSSNMLFRSLIIDDFADIIFEALDYTKDPTKLAEWILEFK